jgi:hypothetical protein
VTASGATNAIASPNVLAGIGLLPAPTIRGTAVATPNVIAAIGLLPAPNAFGGSQGVPVSGPTFAVPISSENELVAVTGANRGSPGSTSNDAEVP